MTRPRALVADIGNIFLGDDAFGVEVVRRLARRPLPGAVRVVDFGIRGLDLAYALLDDYEAAVLVDAAPRGGRPGTLYVLELEATAAEGTVAVDGHDLDPAKALRIVAAMGGRICKILLVACESQRCGDLEQMVDGLSAPVRAAVDEAVGLVETLVERLLRGDAAVPAEGDPPV